MFDKPLGALSSSLALPLTYNVKTKFIIFSSIFVSLVIVILFYVSTQTVIAALEKQLLASRYVGSLEAIADHLCQCHTPMEHHLIDSAHDKRLLQDLESISVAMKGSPAAIEQLVQQTNAWITHSRHQTGIGDGDAAAPRHNLTTLLRQQSDLLMVQLQVSHGKDPITYFLSASLYRLLPRLLSTLDQYQRDDDASHSHALMAQTAAALLNDLSRLVPMLPQNEQKPLQQALLSFAASWQRLLAQGDARPDDAALGAAWASALSLRHRLNALLQEDLEAQLTAMRYRQYLGIGSILCGVLYVLIMYSTRSMHSPLSQLQHVAHQVTKGNLAERCHVTSADEVGVMAKSFNALTSFLERMIAGTYKISQRLISTIDAISLSAKTFEQNTTAQEKAIAHIVQHTQEISKMDKQVSKALQQASSLAIATNEFAKAGQQHIEVMEAVMTMTSSSARQIVNALNALEKKVLGVNTIITTIVTIADQANLLAINTALMANNTRDNPSGFAVIADKIKELAGQTAFITLNIEEAVKAILQAIKKATTQVEVLTQDVANHHELVVDIIKQFNTLLTATEKQLQSLEKVRATIAGQQATTAKIHETITLLSQSAKITTQSVRYLYHQIQNLREASNTLQQVLLRFLFHPHLAGKLTAKKDPPLDKTEP